VLSKARGLITSNRLPEAEQLLRNAVAQQPNSAQLHGGLGDLLFSQKRYSDAIDEFGRAAQLEPDNPSYSMRLAGTLVSWGHYKVAIDLLRALNEKFGHLAEYHYNLGMAYFGLNDFNTAQTDFQKTVAMAPHLASAYFFLGNCFASLKQFQQAAEALRKVLNLDPKRADYCVALGEELSHIPDQASGAIEWFRKSLALRPGCVLAEYCLAVEYTKRGNLKEATPLLERLTAQHPEALKAHIILARVYARMGKKEDAERETAIAGKLAARQRQQTSSPGDPLASATP
jgi:tetratricopeptide (TPR) repeat protein